MNKFLEKYEDLLVTLVMLLLSACIIWDHTKIYKLEKIVDQQQQALRLRNRIFDSDMKSEPKDTIIILRTQLEAN